MYDERFMRKAIQEAKLAQNHGDVPVGAVVVLNGEVISAAHNTREKEGLAIAHAEVTAIKEACLKLGTWRLDNCDLYVTLEPCPMCAGAIINARIKNLYFGAYDKKAGCAGSVLDLFEYGFNHRPNCFGGLLNEECRKILSVFFQKLRE